MILLSLALIFITFFQETVWSWDFLLIILICRSFIIDEKNNYYLALALGILVALISGMPLGIMSFFYLISVKAARMIKALPISSSWAVLPLSLVLLLLGQVIRSRQLGLDIDVTMLILKIGMVPIVYLLVKFWEDRFIPGQGIKLKLRK